MKITASGIPSSEFMPCSKRMIKEAFEEADLEWVGLGWPSRPFRFDSAWSHPPKTEGPIAAQLTIPRPPGRPYLCIYPMHRDRSTEHVIEQMRTVILPKFRDWLSARKARLETSVLGYETIIAEWSAPGFRFHEGRYR